VTSPTDTALAPPPSPAHRLRTAGRVAVVVVIALAATAAQWGYGNRHDFADLRIYYGAVRWWSHGSALYDFAVPDPVQGHLGFTYPPFAALVMYPMAWMSLFHAVEIMWVLSAIAVVVTTAWLVVPVADRHGWPRWFAVCLAVPLVSVLEPVRETVTFGQINLLLALLVLADLLVLAPRGSRFTGTGIGLAAAIKLTPAIFIVYLLVSRRYRAAAVATGTAIAATLLAAAFRPGDSWHYWTSIVWQSSRVGHLAFIPNQSLLGALSRLAHPHQASRLIWVLLAVAVLGFGLWRAARAARAGDEVAGLTLTGVTGSLVSPVSWQHHLYWFIPALAVLVDVAASREARRRWWYAGFAALLWFTVTFSVIAWYDWRIVPASITYQPLGQVIDDWHVLLMLAILAILPVRRHAGRGWPGGRGRQHAGLTSPPRPVTPEAIARK
jgi:alpha-1,2-mannosyltransferase